MTGDKFDPARFNTAKPWQPTPTPWAPWPTVKAPRNPVRRMAVGAAVVTVVLLVLACWWPPAAGILGVVIAFCFAAKG